MLHETMSMFDGNAMRKFLKIILLHHWSSTLIGAKDEAMKW